MDTGMIIIGFPGIGKSSVASKSSEHNAYAQYVDLESSCFNLTNPTTNKVEKCKDWEKFYITVAYHLAKQGKYVFVSNHPAVITEIITRKQCDFTLDNIPIVFVYPSIDLKDKWIDRLQSRYDLSRTLIPEEADKNEAALKGVKAHYDEWITDLDKRDVTDTSFYGHNVYKIPLRTTSYRLEDVLAKFIDDYTYLQDRINDLVKLKNNFYNMYCNNKKDGEDE